MNILSSQDPEVYAAIDAEAQRQQDGLELIASENYTSPAVMQAVGSVLTLTNSVGFGISIASILLFVSLADRVALAQLLPWLALGPALGLWALWPLVQAERVRSV